MNSQLSANFESLMEGLLIAMNYNLVPPTDKAGYDFLTYRYGHKYFIEVKLYRAEIISTKILSQLAQRLNVSMTNSTEEKVGGLLILSAVVPMAIREMIFTEHNVTVWDRQVLSKFIVDDYPEFTDAFQQILLKSQVDSDTLDVYEAARSTSATSFEIPISDTHLLKPIDDVPKLGDQLILDIKGIVKGREGWRQYEQKCLEILNYLFEDDLTMWNAQLSTDDELSRFDVVCRIASTHEYWKSLARSFNSRFVLFEFKNYKEGITQQEIYTTERYLLKTALRSIGFIFSRVDPSKGAKIAAKGALRENEKLLLLLTDDDLIAMLEQKDTGGLPSDYLADKLDEWLVTIAR